MPVQTGISSSLSPVLPFSQHGALSMSATSQAISYQRALEAVTAWQSHAARLQAERDAARSAELTARLEAANLRAELRRIRGE